MIPVLAPNYKKHKGMKSAALLKLTAATALCVVLASCKSMSRTLEEEGFDNTTFSYEQRMDATRWQYGDIAPCRGYKGPLVSQTHDFLRYTGNDVLRISDLLIKKKLDPSQSEKYDRLIEQERVRLQDARDRRINERTAFLTAFYVDLYSMTQKDFTKKYRWKCTGSIKYAMKGIYEAHHGKRGYAWGIFGDKTIHTEKDISCSQPDNEAFYKDEIAPFARNDNPWYEVQLGENSVKLKLEGTGKHIMITSLINPILGLTLDDDTTENH